MPTPFTDDQRREIAGRARTLYERLEGPSNVRGDDPPIDPDAIVEAWRSRFPDEDSFRDRLRRDGLTEETVREHAAATRFPPDEPLPDWIDALEELIEDVESRSPRDRTTCRIDTDERPFGDLLAAIAAAARDRLLERDDAVPADALEPMVEWLVDRLERLCVRPLYVEFKSFVAERDPELARAEPDAYADPTTTYYERFVEAAFDGGLAGLCLEYPVLARHLIRLIDDWKSVVRTVSRRVRDDRRLLRERFDVDGPVTALRPLARETHSGGRTPVRVSFGETDVVYKPKSVETGIAVYAILDRLEEHCSVPPFDAPTYVSCEGYGWMEAIEYRDPADDAAVDRYYERAGALVCLAYCLEFIDIQFENVITDGERPTVVDTETVFHPHVEPAGKNVADGIDVALGRSVFLTGSLPVDAGSPSDFDDVGVGPRLSTLTDPARRSDGPSEPSPRETKAKAIAGLGSRSGPVRVPVRTRPVIEAVNTDVMSVSVEPVTRDATTNTPTVDGEDRPPADHLEAILRGFDETYRTIARLRDEGRFRSEIVPRELVSGLENRLVYRPTHRYTAVLRRLRGRDPLRDGVRSTVAMEDLAVPFFDGSIDADEYWPLYEAEREELHRLDVPRFTSHADRREIRHEGTDVGVAASEAGYDRCLRRVDAMSEADRRRQRWLLRQCYEVGSEDQSGTSTSSSASAAPASVDVTDDRLRRTAVDLLDDVLESAVRTGDGRAWTYIDPTRTETARVLLADDSLSRGRAGIALAAAAAYRATGRARYRRVAVEVLEPMLDSPVPDADSIALGAPVGVGSTIYTLSTVADLLEDDRFRRAAVDAARSVTEDRLPTDDRLGVAAGYAGTLLALLSCYDRSGDATVLERARSCGDRLLENGGRDACRQWRSNDEDAPARGFARGAPGIAYALARLAATAGEPRYAEPVRASLAAEPTSTSASASAPAATTDGADSLVDGSEIPSDGWYCGKSGLALSAIGIAEHLAEPRLLEDVSASLDGIARSPLSDRDDLCRGNFGRIEALLVGANRADGDAPDATDVLGRCLARRDREGSFSLPGHSQWAVDPSFFGGCSGLAYTLLRLRRAEDLPCVLRFE